MTIKFTTVDNLGIEAHKQYARRQKELEETRETGEASRIAGTAAEVPVVAPYYAAEDEFSIGSVTSWAAFAPPPSYAMLANRFFTHQLIPSIGSADRQQDAIDKLTAREGELKGQDPDGYQKVSNMLSTLHQMTRTFDLIVSRCNQYHRG